MLLFHRLLGLLHFRKNESAVAAWCNSPTYANLLTTYQQDLLCFYLFIRIIEVADAHSNMVKG